MITMVITVRRILKILVIRYPLISLKLLKKKGIFAPSGQFRPQQFSIRSGENNLDTILHRPGMWML